MLKEVNIKARSSFAYEVTASSKAQVIKWCFLTRSKNIAFGLLLKSPLCATRGSGEVISSFPLPVSRNGSDCVYYKSLEELSAEENPYPSGYDEGPRRSNTTMSRMALSLSKKSKSHSRISSSYMELEPIKHYNSSKVTIRGEYTVTVPGTYVLFFDNTFSVSKSKYLYFAVSVSDGKGPSPASPSVEIQGWVYKKAERRIKGYIRRWAFIDTNGMLRYSKYPETTPRHPINLAKASVNFNKKRSSIVIDTERCTIHLKFTLWKEYKKWVTAIHKYVSFSPKALPANFGSLIAQGDESIILEMLKRTSLERNTLKTPETEKEIADILAKLNSLLSFSNSLDLGKSEKDVLESSLKNLANSVEGNLTRTMYKDLQKRDAYIKALQIALMSCDKGRRLLSMSRSKDDHIQDKVFSESINQNSVHKNSMQKNSIHKNSIHQSSPSKSSDDADEMFFDAIEEAFSETSSLSSSTSAVLSVKSSSSGSSKSSNSACCQVAGYSGSQMGSVVGSESIIQGESGSIIGNESIIQGRTELPCKEIPFQKKSIMKILRDSIGKDLSRISMPITLNEPINLIQKLCQQFEYSELLDAAAKADDKVSRLELLAAFVISSFCASTSTTGRKPFNPLLGETYEFISKDKGIKFVGEKVSQYPGVVSCYAEGRGYAYQEQNQMRTKFWGRSLEFIQSGISEITFQTGEKYTWNKISTNIRNIFSQKPTLELKGVIQISPLAFSDVSCTISIGASGYFKPASAELEGVIRTKILEGTENEGEVISKIRGSWNSHVERQRAGLQREVLWKSRNGAYANNSAYDFSPFSMHLNELDGKLAEALPQTDTRLRPDQRLYEEGKLEKAELEKARLEQKQRKARMTMELEGKKWKPLWFDLVSDTPQKWVYNNTYWQSRKKSFSNAVMLELW